MSVQGARRRPINRRPVSEHFRADGRPKKALSRSEAKSAAYRAGKRAYECGFCGAWHIGQGQ
jgi:hypothetical protein